MKAKEIRDLIDFISGSGLEEVNIETEEFKINVKRSSPQLNMASAPAPIAPVVNQAAAAPTAPAATEATEATPSSDSDNLIKIKSPMIGTFYRSANPESDVFVNVGDSIKVGDTLCIIEAMKLFNEIESEVSGKIIKVLVENAEPVEYDQPLFLVDPS